LENILDYENIDEDGSKKKLKDIINSRWTVLYVYPKDNTPGCTIEAKEFSQLIGEFEKIGYQVIGVSMDSVESHRRFKARHGLKVRLVSDPEGKLIRALGAWGKKRSFGNVREGVIRSTFIFSPDGTLMWKKINVRAKNHAYKVLEIAKNIQTEKGRIY
jgi:peroxiredoxin Q/BCP